MTAPTHPPSGYACTRNHSTMKSATQRRRFALHRTLNERHPHAEYLPEDVLLSKTSHSSSARILLSSSSRNIRHRQRPKRKLNHYKISSAEIQRMLLCVLIALSLVPRGQSFCSVSPSRHFQNHQSSSDPSSTISFLPQSSKRSSTTQLHGIKGFRSFFSSAFPSSVSEVNRGPVKCDHLLIDVNQFLHTAVRRGRSEKSAVINIMKELDNCIALAPPTKSIVLAMDGPPPAAKLATQRKRRQQTLDRIDMQMKLFQRLAKSKKKKSQRVLKLMTRKKRKWQDALDTLAITPGTAFMNQAATTILYWAWQRLQRRRASPLHGRQVFFSSADTPGEGEVKLMEWLQSPVTNNIIGPRDQVILMGGDSDLVLEALLVRKTPHVTVLMPVIGAQYLAVSIPHVMESLRHDYHLVLDTEEHELAVRTDLVFLLFLNGNDYLPKLRGSGGFGQLLRLYASLQREYSARQEPEGHPPSRGPSSIVDPETLEFNQEFAMDFFGKLNELYGGRSIAFNQNDNGTSAEDRLGTSQRGGNYGGMNSLSRLYNLRDSGLIPREAKYEIVDGDDNETLETSAFGNEEELNDDDPGFSTANEIKEHVMVKLYLGKPNTEEYGIYETSLPRYQGEPMGNVMKRGRHLLAAKVIEDYFGTEDGVLDDDLFESGDDDDRPDVDDNASQGEVTAASVSNYIYGLLWNLRKYKTGICSDFGFNYGKRLAPTAGDIFEFLRNGQVDLPEPSEVEPISPGLSCVAALPISVRYLLPEPYSFLSNETIEEVYSACVKEDNSFDIATFSDLCNSKLGPEADEWKAAQAEETRSGRLRPSEKGWAVLVKKKDACPSPRKPPKLESKSWKLEELYPDRHIWAFEWSRGKRPSLEWNQNDVPIEHSIAAIAPSDNGKSQERKREQTSSPKGRSQKAFLEEEIAIETVDGFSALSCLRFVESLEIVEMESNWSFNDGMEESKLIVRPVGLPGNSVLNRTLTFSRGRFSDSPKSRRQHDHEMASQVLSLMYPGWPNMRFKEFKKLVSASKAQLLGNHGNGKGKRHYLTLNADGTDAITCLKQLQDLGLLHELRFEATGVENIENRDAEETITLTLRTFDGRKKVYEQRRPWYGSISRKSVRHCLAAEALTGIAPNWFDQTFEEIKAVLV